MTTTKEQQAAYRDRNRDKINARAKKQARNWRADHRDLSRVRDGIRRHGRNFLQAWNDFWEAQDGKCYLCGDDMNPEQTQIDHDHRCCPQSMSCEYCRRGLACNRCNLLIGHSDDDPDRLRRIADSLEAASADVTRRLDGKPEQLQFGTG